MPLSKLSFAPGIQKDDSPLAGEGGYIDADKVRFVSVGKNWAAQTIGGYESVILDTFDGIARGGHAWATSTGRRTLAWGTAAKLYALVSGAITDITPPHSEGVLTDPFTTSNGSASVSVTHTDHGLATGASVTFSNQSSTVGGLTLTGPYTITVSDEDTYTFTAGGAAGSSATGGGNVDYVYALLAGLVDGTGEPGGYGTGTYGSGGYGTTTDVVDINPRVWFLDNWGHNLVACPLGGGLYEWQPAESYPELVTNGDFASATGWTAGVNWAIGAGVATATVANTDLSRAVTLEPGKMYRVVFTVTRTVGSVLFKTNVGTFTEASAAISVSGTYSRLFRAQAGATTLVFTGTGFTGTIDNVSIKLEDAAYRIDEAPTKNLAMFVDPHQVVVLLGTTPYGSVFSQLAVRWCDRQDLTDWTPSVSNLAGDDILASGSRLIGGIATRQQNVIWSDSAAYSMQFTNDASNPFIFQLLGTGCGLIAPLARAEHNGTVFWAATDNFYIFNGAVPQPIPCSLRRDFFGNIAVNQNYKLHCGVVHGFSEVWFFSPDARDGNECSRYASLNWEGGIWSCGTFERSTWIKSGVVEYPIGFGTDGMLYYHEKGTSANGGALTAFLESGYVDLGDGDKLMMISRIVGDFDDLQGSVDFTLTARFWPTSDDIEYGPFTHINTTPYLNMRALGRQIKMRLDSSATPSFWRVGAVKVDITPTGARR
jgi:hypothetical protein